MRANPVTKGAPVSSETYSAPSGPIAPAVATGATGGAPFGGGFGRRASATRVETVPFAATSSTLLPPASATSCRPGRASTPYGFESTRPLSGLTAASYDTGSAIALISPEAAIFSSLPESSRSGPSNVRIAGVPGRPIVTYAPPTPWNEMSFGPASASIPLADAIDGSPLTHSSWTPPRSRLIAPVGPKHVSRPRFTRHGGPAPPRPVSVTYRVPSGAK